MPLVCVVCVHQQDTVIMTLLCSWGLFFFHIFIFSACLFTYFPLLLWVGKLKVQWLPIYRNICYHDYLQRKPPNISATGVLFLFRSVFVFLGLNYYYSLDCVLSLSLFDAAQAPNCHAANTSQFFPPYLISLEYSFSWWSLLLNFQLKMAMYTSRTKMRSREPTAVPIITANLFGAGKVQINDVMLASCVYCQGKGRN